MPARRGGRSAGKRNSGSYSGLCAGNLAVNAPIHHRAASVRCTRADLCTGRGTAGTHLRTSPSTAAKRTSRSRAPRWTPTACRAATALSDEPASSATASRPRPAPVGISERAATVSSDGARTAARRPCRIRPSPRGGWADSATASSRARRRTATPRPAASGAATTLPSTAYDPPKTATATDKRDRRCADAPPSQHLDFTTVALPGYRRALLCTRY